MKKIPALIAAIIILALLSTCVRKENHEALGTSMISEVNLREHIKFISHDLTEGREIASRGEKIAQEYIATQYAINGIMPGGDDGTYFQNFELVKHSTRAMKKFVLRRGSINYSPQAKKDVIALAAQNEAFLSIEAGIVYVGYGIDAPEFDWDDYQDQDIRGKVCLVLLGEPSSDDPDFFKGEEDTDYAGLNYKIKMAGEKGAAGVILVYDEKTLRLPWMALVGYFSRPQTKLKHDKSRPAGMQIISLVSKHGAEKIIELAGLNLLSLQDKAKSSKFESMNLEIELNAEIESTFEPIPCRNVVGVVPGKIPDEYVLYTAHTDHMGIGRPEDGDNIYNGAIDDASGCASLIEIGRVFASLPFPPERSVILACVTAEEVGLLGSKYYAQNPAFPLQKTLAVINLDGVLPWGKAKDFVFIGAERSSLGELAAELAKDNDMVLTPDIMNEENFYMRSDHYSLAQEGLPGGMLVNGFQFLDKPEDWGLEELKKWLKEVYHHPSDEFSEDWKMETVVQINQIAFQFGYRIAHLNSWPTWNNDQTFKKVRERSLSQ